MLNEGDGRPLVDFLIESGAIPSSLGCPKGCGNMTIVRRRHNFEWACHKYVKKRENRKKEKCGFTQSIRKFTFFEKSQI